MARANAGNYRIHFPAVMPPEPPETPEITAAASSPLVRSLLADLGIEAGGVELAIDPADEMLGFLVGSQGGDRERALYAYFQSGASIAAAMAQVLRWRFGDPRRTGRLLDFASGYGRVTRFLVRLLQAERIWVADVYAGGVDFQRRRFGVHGIVSTTRPEDFPAAAAAGPGTFDAILVTSLFTHLPEERFVAWLRMLMGLLAPGGVLAFSVHGAHVLPGGAELPASGLLFQEISESGSLSGAEYGSSWVSEEFVRGALGRALGGGAPGAGAVAGAAPPAAASGGGSLLRLPRGLCNYQDLYVAVPEARADFSGLGFRGEPYLFVERCLMAGADRLELSGWAGVLGSGSLAAVEALLDGEVLARMPIEGERPEVAELLGEPRLVRSGWGGACRLPQGASRASLLSLRVIDDLGAAHPEAAATLEAALHDSTRLEVTALLRDLHLARVQAERQRLEAEALRARIAAMEASRFWKLRNQWFRVKGWFGVGEG
jgi:SAM-dependent methyltransferase